MNAVLHERIRVLIAASAPLMRLKLRKTCSRQEDLEIVAEADGFAAMLEAVRTGRPDLLLLDASMFASADSSLSESLRDGELPATILVGRKDDLGEISESINIIGTAPRSVSTELLRLMVNRLRWSRISDFEEYSKQRGRRPRRPTLNCKRLIAERSRQLHLLEPSTIDFLGAEGNYVVVHSGPNKFLCRDTLKNLEVALAEFGFMRIRAGSC